MASDTSHAPPSSNSAPSAPVAPSVPAPSPRLPRLLLNVPEASKTQGLEIRRNGILVGSAQWGVPLPVDPGEVELTASAPGKQTLRQTLRAEEGKTASYSVPALLPGDATAAAPLAGSAAPAPATPALMPQPAAPAPSAPREVPAAKSSGNTPLILALAGVGVVGVGVGTVFAVTAKNKYNESKSNGRCDLDDANSCSATGVGLRNDARSQGNIATIGFIAGGAALAGAGIVWLFTGTGGSDQKHASSPAHLRATPAVAPNLAALFVQGSF